MEVIYKSKALEDITYWKKTGNIQIQLWFALATPIFNSKYCIFDLINNYQISDAVSVSTKTLNRWLKNDSQEVEKLGFKDGDKLLNPAVVKFICEKYVIEL